MSAQNKKSCSKNVQVVSLVQKILLSFLSAAIGKKSLLNYITKTTENKSLYDFYDMVFKF